MMTLHVSDLERIAARSDGKLKLGALVRRLVCASLAKSNPNLHFLSDETNNEPGWDGYVQSSVTINGEAQLHSSVWELSANKNIDAKIRQDYKAALKKKLPFTNPRTEVTYVAVTLRKITASKKEKLVTDLRNL